MKTSEPFFRVWVLRKSPSACRDYITVKKCVSAIHFVGPLMCKMATTALEYMIERALKEARLRVRFLLPLPIGPRRG